jgi:hypothetical protein
MVALAPEQIGQYGGGITLQGPDAVPRAGRAGLMSDISSGTAAQYCETCECDVTWVNAEQHLNGLGDHVVTEQIGTADASRCSCSPVSGFDVSCPEHGVDAMTEWSEDERRRLAHWRARTIRDWAYRLRQRMTHSSENFIFNVREG